MRALWLADVLRDAGLTVHEYPGWRTRGSASWGPLRGVICHATAGSRSSTDAGETRVLWVTGSTSAPAPISQLYLSRSGQWWVGASGRCNHVLTGHKGPHRGFGNSALLGIEAQNDNRGEPWSAEMLDSYQRGVAAICRHMGWEAWRAVAHAEHQNGKSDPLGIDMDALRRRVAALIEEDDVSWQEELWIPQWIMDRWGDSWPNRRIRTGGALVSGYGHSRVANENTQRLLRETRAGFAAVLAQQSGQDVAAAVGQLLDDDAERERQERAAELAELRDGLAGALLAELGPALVDALGEAAGELPADAVEAAVERALARTSLTVEPAGDARTES